MKKLALHSHILKFHFLIVRLTYKNILTKKKKRIGQVIQL